MSHKHEPKITHLRQLTTQKFGARSSSQMCIRKYFYLYTIVALRLSNYFFSIEKSDKHSNRDVIKNLNFFQLQRLNASDFKNCSGTSYCDH